MTLKMENPAGQGQGFKTRDRDKIRKSKMEKNAIYVKSQPVKNHPLNQSFMPNRDNTPLSFACSQLPYPATQPWGQE